MVWPNDPIFAVFFSCLTAPIGASILVFHVEIKMKQEFPASFQPAIEAIKGVDSVPFLKVYLHTALRDQKGETNRLKLDARRVERRPGPDGWDPSYVYWFATFCNYSSISPWALVNQVIN